MALYHLLQQLILFFSGYNVIGLLADMDREIFCTLVVITVCKNSGPYIFINKIEGLTIQFGLSVQQ